MSETVRRWREYCGGRLQGSVKAESANQMLNDARNDRQMAKQKQHEQLRARYHSLNVTQGSTEMSPMHDFAPLK